MDSKARKILAAVTILLATYIGTALAQPASAEPIKIENGTFARALDLPVYQWQDNKQTPKAVVLAIHGLTMHGTVFDTCARKLAADGIIVVALDLRGYGDWYKGRRKSQINYLQSEKDLNALASSVREQYKGLPLFLAGESLGGSMAIRLAAKNPGLIDGLVLASPAIKLHISLKTVASAFASVAKPSHQVDVSNIIKKDFSEDPQITAEGMTDPLIRTRLSMRDLYRSCQFISANRKYISKVPSNIPVLVLQGAADRIVSPRGAAVLDSNLRTADKSIQLLPARGHILIETQHVHQDTMNTILSWVDSKCATQSAVIVSADSRKLIADQHVDDTLAAKHSLENDNAGGG